jgi:hypothetical protein
MGHRVEGVGRADDAGLEWDLLTVESLGIPAAVEALVVAVDDRRQVFQASDPGVFAWAVIRVFVLEEGNAFLLVAAAVLVPLGAIRVITSRQIRTCTLAP